MSDLSTILADNQSEMLKQISPSVEKSSNLQNLGNSDSKTEKILAAPTSTPSKLKRLFPISVSQS